MNRNYVFNVIFIVSMSSSLKAELPNIVTSKLQEFIDQMVIPEDKAQFTEFYNTLLKHETTLRQKKNEKVLEKHKTEQIELGLCSLEVRKADLYQQIKPYLDSTNKTTKKEIETFLYRYGAYEKYMQQKSSHAQPILVKAQHYANEMKNHIVSFAHRLDPRRIFNY